MADTDTDIAVRVVATAEPGSLAAVRVGPARRARKTLKAVS
jgi:hypothetical protein